MWEPLISIIMPIYNSQTYLREALESLSNQTVQCFELIAIDDASQDGSAELVTEFSVQHPDIPVRLIQNQKNVGNCSARNIGLRQARREYICMMDSDDLYREDYLERLLGCIEDAGADMAFCGYDCYHQDRGTYRQYLQFKRYPPSQCKRTLLYHYLLGHTHIAHWACIYRRTFLEKNHLQYMEGWHIAGDTEFICKALLCCRSISFVPASLYIYRVHAGSITTRTPDRTAFETYVAYLRVLQSIHDPVWKMFFFITKQARATNIILGKFYSAGVPMPYLYCPKYAILCYQILHCLISRPPNGKLLLRYYIDTYLK